ncbi:uncharacterized protein FTOL_06413 [Fusarium torulosum]|uniref:Uncharacterized protein n=1 Tax=Fusarium torulosum TaxID=33205 RepID=A0AAE8SI19_9HYPO|nr:uncharacterized protein FTOL_06413 [Fusarium torulosum]
MDYPTPASSQVSDIYDAVMLLFQKLQSLSPRVYGTLDVNFTTQDGRSILSLKAEVGGPKAQDDAARSLAPYSKSKQNSFLDTIRAFIKVFGSSFRRTSSTGKSGSSPPSAWRTSALTFQTSRI